MNVQSPISNECTVFLSDDELLCKHREIKRLHELAKNINSHDKEQLITITGSTWHKVQLLACASVENIKKDRTLWSPIDIINSPFECSPSKLQESEEDSSVTIPVEVFNGLVRILGIKRKWDENGISTLSVPNNTLSQDDMQASNSVLIYCTFARHVKPFGIQVDLNSNLTNVFLTSLNTLNAHKQINEELTMSQNNQCQIFHSTNLSCTWERLLYSDKTLKSLHIKEGDVIAFEFDDKSLKEDLPKLQKIPGSSHLSTFSAQFNPALIKFVDPEHSPIKCISPLPIKSNFTLKNEQLTNERSIGDVDMDSDSPRIQIRKIKDDMSIISCTRKIPRVNHDTSTEIDSNVIDEDIQMIDPQNEPSLSCLSSIDSPLNNLNDNFSSNSKENQDCPFDCKRASSEVFHMEEYEREPFSFSSISADSISLPRKHDLLITNENKPESEPKTTVPSSLRQYDPYQPKFSDNVRNRGTRQQIYGINGIKNLGNTCFMNSALQCLMNIPRFRDFLKIANKDWWRLSNEQIHQRSVSDKSGLYGKRERTNAGELTCVLSSFICSMWGSSKQVGDAGHIKSVVGRISNRFCGYSQHDSQEFMCVLLDSLHEELKVLGKFISDNVDDDHIKPTSLREGSDDKLKKGMQSMINSAKSNVNELSKQIDNLSNDRSLSDNLLGFFFHKIHSRSGFSFILKTFQGQIKSTVQCLSCYHYSRTFDPFMFLCLPVINERQDNSRAIDKYSSFRNDKRYHYGKHHNRHRRSSSECTKPDMEETSLIIYGVLITMDALIHPIAICMSNRNESIRENNDSSHVQNHKLFSGQVDDVEQPKLSDQLNGVWSVGSGLPKNNYPEVAGSIDTEMDDSSVTSSNDGCMACEENCLSAITVKDLLESASNCTVFLKSKSCHEVPRLKLVGPQQLQHSLFRCNNASSTGQRDNVFYQCISEDTKLLGLVHYFDSNESTAQFNSLNAAADREKYNRFDHPDLLPLRCRLANGIVLCQYPPSCDKEDTNLPNSVIVTLRMENCYRLFPLIMSYHSIRDLYTVTAKFTSHSIKDQDNSASDKSSCHTSILILAHRALQCLGFNLKATKCHDLISVIPSEKLTRQSTLLVIAEFQPADIVPASVKREFNRSDTNYNKCTTKNQARDFACVSPTNRNQQLPLTEMKEHCLQSDNIGKSVTNALYAMNNHSQLPDFGSTPSSLTLDQCLGMFTETELLATNESWRCPKCAKKCISTKKMDIHSLPPILLIQLKRFRHCSNWRERVDTLVEFPIDLLDLEDLVPSSNDTTIKGGKNLYKLIAVSHHSGSLCSGHYTAYARNSCNNKWFHFNDSWVNVVEHPEIKLISEGAYILVYERFEETC